MERTVWKTDLGANTTSAIETAGATRYEDDGNGKRTGYIYVEAGATLAAGDVCYWVAAGTYKVSKTRIAGSTSAFTNITTQASSVAGVAIGVITSGSFGWIKCEGESAVTLNVDPDGTATAGMFVGAYASGGTAGTCQVLNYTTAAMTDVEAGNFLSKFGFLTADTTTTAATIRFRTV